MKEIMSDKEITDLKKWCFEQCKTTIIISGGFSVDDTTGDAQKLFDWVASHTNIGAINHRQI